MEIYQNQTYLVSRYPINRIK